MPDLLPRSSTGREGCHGRLGPSSGILTGLVDVGCGLSGAPGGRSSVATPRQLERSHGRPLAVMPADSAWTARGSVAGLTATAAIPASVRCHPPWGGGGGGITIRWNQRGLSPPPTVYEKFKIFVHQTARESGRCLEVFHRDRRDHYTPFFGGRSYGPHGVLRCSHRE